MSRACSAATTFVELLLSAIATNWLSSFLALAPDASITVVVVVAWLLPVATVGREVRVGVVVAFESLIWVVVVPPTELGGGKAISQTAMGCWGCCCDEEDFSSASPFSSFRFLQQLASGASPFSVGVATDNLP